MNVDSTQVPIHQATCVWEAFDQYIKDLIKANPKNTFDNEDWYDEWKRISHILLDWNTHPNVDIILITNNPTSTFVDAVKTVINRTPFLADDCIIKYDSADEEVISFFIKPYQTKVTSNNDKSENQSKSKNDKPKVIDEKLTANNDQYDTSTAKDEQYGGERNTA